jgi:hypothetical protein
MGHLHTPLLVVLGHTKCGAVTAVASGAAVHGSIPGLVDNIIPAVDAARRKNPTLSGPDLIARAIEENVLISMRDVLARSPEVRELVASGHAEVVGAVYDIDTGTVRWIGNHPEQAAILSNPTAFITPANSPSHASPTAHAAPASRPGGAKPIDSSGRFAEPALSIRNRPPFGAESGAASALHQGEVHAHRSDTMVWVLAIAAGVVAILCIITAARLCRVRKPSGENGLALTMAGKLVLGFGGLTASILVLSTFATRAVVDLTNVAIDEADLSGQVRIVTALQTDTLAIHAAVLDFLNDPTDEALRHYSDLAATLASSLKLARERITDPAQDQQLSLIASEFEELNAEFARVVEKSDRVAGIIDSQMGPSAERAAALLILAEQSADSGGEAHDALSIAQAAVRFESARTAVFRYFRDRKDSMAELAIQQADKAINEIKEAIAASAAATA